MLGTMYTAPITHIRESFGGRARRNDRAKI